MDETADWSLRRINDAYLQASRQALSYQKALAETRAAELEASGRALRQQTAILETALNGMRDGVWVCDEEGRHLLMNHAAEAMFGPRQPGAKIVGSVDALYAEDGVTPIAPDAMPLAKAIRGEPTDDVRAVAKMPGHEPALVLMHGRPLRDASGQPFGGVAVIRDITAIERLSQHSATLEQENQRVRASNRLRNQFMANMSHELRTPLNAVIGFAELMRDGNVGPVLPEQREILGDILSSGHHLLDIINDLLDLAKVEAGKMSFKPELFDLKTLIDETCSVFRAAAAPQRVGVVSVVNEAIGAVMLDPRRVRQVLYNYLSNAVKFTADGGHIVVRAEPHGDDAFLLEVEDDGVGIESDDQQRLFTPFQQLDRSVVARFGGTGLGLALTRRIVEAQGGSVGVRSTPGAGSVFRAILPRTTTSTRSGSLIPPRNEPGP
jgi:PAS domain S-box-containing protein